MTNDVKQEILKAHIYGRTTEEISAVMNLDPTEVSAVIATSTNEIAEKRAYIEQNTPSIKAMTALKDSTGTHYGIDISVWNGAVDMAKVKAAGKDFVFTRSVVEWDKNLPPTAIRKWHSRNRLVRPRRT